MYRVKILRPFAVLTMALLSLAACGGGGGGTPLQPGNIPGQGGTTTTQSFGKSQTRSEAQTAMTAYAQAAGQSATGALSTVRRIMDVRAGRRTLAAPVCSVGTLNSFSTVTVTNANGSTTETDTTYYDLACATPETITVTNVPVIAPGASTATVTGNTTTFDRSGNVTGFTAITATVISTSSALTITLTEKVGPNQTAAAVAQIGVTCSAPTATPSTVTCGAADVLASATGSSGSTLATTQTSTAATGINLTSTTTESFSASLFSGTTLGIAQGTGTIWNVTGASPFSTVTGNISVTSNGSFPASGTLSLTDTVSNVTVSGTVAATGITLTIKQGATILATVVTDANGNGTITYADGTTETITDYTIKST
jgi:hypothetical protein